MRRLDGVRQSLLQPDFDWFLAVTCTCNGNLKTFQFYRPINDWFFLRTRITIPLANNAKFLLPMKRFIPHRQELYTSDVYTMEKNFQTSTIILLTAGSTVLNRTHSHILYCQLGGTTVRVLQGLSYVADFKVSLTEIKPLGSCSHKGMAEIHILLLAN